MRYRATLLIVIETQGSLTEPLVYVFQLGGNRCAIMSKNCWNDLLALYFNQQVFGEDLFESTTGEQGNVY